MCNLWIKKYNMSPSKIDHLNNYMVIKKLGSGGFSNVKLYKCRNKNENGERCNNLFVVKKILKRKFNILYSVKFSEESAKYAMLKEYNIMKNLNNDNIIKCLDISKKHDKLIFEYFPAIDFFDYLGKFHSYNTTSLMFYMKQIIDAVDYLHKMNVCHMDIKQENILLDLNTNKIKLIDFGCACYHKKNGEVDIRYDQRGTRSCFSPEMCEDNGYDPAKCDVWCVGVMLYNLVYNKFTPWSYASYSDQVYNECKKFFDINNLHPLYFKELRSRGYSENDEKIIFKIFRKIFRYDRDLRPNISVIKSDFEKLSIFI